MSLYVDRWCGRLERLPATSAYLRDLGVNLLHLMPLFESPAGESDGGYAVSDLRKVDPLLGSLDDLRAVSGEMKKQWMYLMTGIGQYQGYYYMFPDRTMPGQYDRSMPEVFPERPVILSM